jgi:hypothetical protein
MHRLLYFLGFLVLLVACNLEQEIELDLPEYEEKVIVEAYLEAGKPYRLLLTRSSSYFSPFPINLEETFNQLLLNDASVFITHNGNTVQLNNLPGLDPETNKIFNYVAGQIAIFDTINPYDLRIVLANGETIESRTTFLPVIPIDSVVYKFQETGLENDSARVLTYFNDQIDRDNFFRRTLYKYKNGDLEEQQDFVTDDRIIEEVIVFGTGYDFALGDTLINRIYNIDEAYYRFLSSLQLAVDANGNPFGQPSPIIPGISSNGDNAIGIFTTLNFAETVTIIQK